MKLTVIFRDDTPMLFCNDSPSYRSVQVELTPEQAAALAPRKTGQQGDVPVYESVSRAIVEPGPATEGTGE